MKNIKKKTEPFLIGVISDTHGLLRPGAIDALRGVNLIIHAGDIGNTIILDGLRALAPVVAVRGNMDSGEWAYKLNRTEIVEIKDMLLYVLHDSQRLDIDLALSGVKVLISGHTHIPSISRHKGILFLNPGSAGPRRSKLSPSVALLKVVRGSLDAQIIEIEE